MSDLKTKPDFSDLDFYGAIEAHIRWKFRLEAYINGTSEEHLDADVVCRDDQCALGKWIHGPGGKHFGTHAKFPELKETHAQFHQCAGDVIRNVDSGELDKARDLLYRGEYAHLSQRVKAQLARLGLELQPLDEKEE